MHSRGSGFFDFAFTCLTIGNLLVAVIFFVAPAKALRITTSIISVLLLIDVIIIVAVPRVRLEEGWVGIASVSWAFFIAVWCILTDRVVAWGKREEEERLTGRPESRRTVKEWLAVTVATIFAIIFIIIALLMTLTLGVRAVHLACVGNVSYTHGQKDATMILEAGETPSEYDFEHWAYNAYQNGTISRYCYCNPSHFPVYQSKY
jgi:hypothetical protein